MIWNCDHFSKLNANLHIFENSHIFNNDTKKKWFITKNLHIFNNMLLKTSFQTNYVFLKAKWL